MNRNNIFTIIIFSVIVLSCGESDQKITDSNPITEIKTVNNSNEIIEVEPEITYEDCLADNTFKGEVSFSSEVLCSGYKK